MIGPKVVAAVTGVALTALFCSCNFKVQDVSSAMAEEKNLSAEELANSELATFGAGCFWCVEAIFQQLEGVYAVKSGYMGGRVENPTYEQVCAGRTGHAEVIQVRYDPQKITFEELLEVFWKTHDPTTLNRQGADRGTQYRSAIFYHSQQQQQLAAKYKQKLDQSGAFDDPIVTEITAAQKFYVAEKYHQNYFNQNSDQRYCQLVIVPKLEKFQKVFKDKLKND